MKALVTGGAGFIGSHLAEGLLAAGYEVLIIDNLSTGRKEYLPQAASFVQTDVSDKEELNKIFKNFTPDYIFHLAAQKDVRLSVQDPAFDARVNILGSLNLIQLAVEYKLKKFIFVSSGGAIYDESEALPFTELTKVNPLSPYGLAKYTIDLYLELFNTLNSLAYVSFRLANVYGPRQDPFGEAGVIAIFFNKLLQNQSLCLNGGGSQTRDFVYVKDVVRALLLGLKPKAHGIYNVGTGKATSIKSLLHQQAEICGVKPVYEITPQIPGEVMRNALSYYHLEQDLGWQPIYDLPKGLAETKQWCRTKQNL